LKVNHVDSFLQSGVFNPGEDFREPLVFDLLLGQIFVTLFVVRTARHDRTASDIRLIAQNDFPVCLQVVLIGINLERVAHLIAAMGTNPISLYET
jgi:hypothetical protein